MRGGETFLPTYKRTVGYNSRTWSRAQAPKLTVASLHCHENSFPFLQRRQHLPRTHESGPSGQFKMYAIRSCLPAIDAAPHRHLQPRILAAPRSGVAFPSFLSSSPAAFGVAALTFHRLGLPATTCRACAYRVTPTWDTAESESRSD